MLVGSTVVSGGLTIEQLSMGDVPVTTAPASTPTNDDIRLNRDGDPIDIKSHVGRGGDIIYDYKEPPPGGR